jgi:hypothetical protein
MCVGDACIVGCWYKDAERMHARDGCGMLQVTPEDARLWCALGDLTLDDEHYRTAWERSGRRSTRAQRSLARAAQRDKDYERVRCPARCTLILLRAPCLCGVPATTFAEESFPE